MIDTLVKVDDRYFLELDASVLRRAGIDPEQPLEVSVDTRGRLVVTQPQDPDARAQFLRVMEEVERKHAETFLRLAQH